MPSVATLTAALAFAASATATGYHRHPGGIHIAAKRDVKYTTITQTTLITTSVPVSTTIDTMITRTGTQTFIPGALTLTFNALPAYFYIETQTMANTVLTSKTTIKVPITESTPPAKSQTSTTLSMNSSPVSSTTSSTSKPTSSTASQPIFKNSTTAQDPSGKDSGTKVTNSNSTSTLSAPSNTATCCINNGNTVTKSAACDGKSDGSTCGSLHSCYQGGCYWFNQDNMCGSLTNSCNTAGGYHCVSGVCTDTLYNTQNCGLAYRVCGDNDGNKYGCYKGGCINLSGDNQNCGTLGNVCPKGTGCKSGNCIDTTSDNNNCSTPGYVCPSGTHCKDSWCQQK